MATLIISSITVLSMVIVILIKPFVNVKNHKLGLYWVVCLFGAVLLILFGGISVKEVLDGVTANTSVNPIKILVLFLSMTVLSIYLGDAGFFDVCADKIFRKANGGQMKLFIALYACVSILTVFTSNDIIILTFTPPILVFAKKAGVSPMPYLVSQFIAANTWSMALIVGNPTNIYLATASGIDFFDYFLAMALPTLCGGLTSLLVLLLLFRKQLKQPLEKAREEWLGNKDETAVTYQKVPLILALCHLIVCIILLAISYYINVEMYLICLALAVSLTLFNLVYGLFKDKNVKRLSSLKKAPYELVPFILSMFVIVLALSKSGFTERLNELFLTGKKTDGLIFGGLSALSSNLLNNIPMSVLFEKVINGESIYALYGAIIGSNVGAFITPVGALAGIMWTKILESYGFKLSFKQFCLYGVTIAVPTLVATCGCLLLT